MENNCVIREDEIELDLGLSIGGSFGKAEKPKPSNNSVADLGETVVFDPQTKRGVQALRRQEARKKREHKQQKGGFFCHRNGEFRSKDGDAVAMEERECKKTRVEEFSGNVKPNLGGELNYPFMCPVRISSPYPLLQFVPLADGFAYPCVNAVQELSVGVNGGFPSFQTAQDSGVNGGNGSTTYSSSTGQSDQTGTATSHQTDSAQSKPQAESEDTSKPVSTNETATTATAKGKPPKPRTPTDDDVLSLGNMPCVSTTGNGPNGKKINGFLYRYRDSEVSIICVCHGSSFTPAEFVQHAGGTDVSHPLRYITMVLVAF
ncbi:hypothetical protein GQ457_05G003960 [Hibiscus cannabinus]